MGCGKLGYRDYSAGARPHLIHIMEALAGLMVVAKA